MEKPSRKRTPSSSDKRPSILSGDSVKKIASRMSLAVGLASAGAACGQQPMDAPDAGEAYSDSSRQYAAYTPSSPDELKAFLESHSLEKESPEETVYALLDWVRDNFVHTGEGFSTREVFGVDHPSVMEVVRSGDQGPIVVEGCRGIAQILAELLTSVGITTQPKPILLRNIITNAPEAHTRVEFTALGKTTFHADDLMYFRRSRGGAFVPADALIVAKFDNKAATEDQTGNHMLYRFRLMDRFLPDASILQYAYDRAHGYEFERFEDPRPFLGDEAGQALLDKMHAAGLKIGDGDWSKTIEILKERIIYPHAR